MASTSAKRPLSPPNAISPNKRVRKRPRVQPKDEDVVLVDDDEDLQTILARINQMEESEQLARKLQKQVGSGSSSNAEIIDIDDTEDDAALARRLAAEWGAETDEPETVDVDAWEPPASAAASSAKAGPSRTLSDEDNVPPDQRLAEFRSFFTAERNCSKCGKPVKSPRGFVRSLPPISRTKFKVQ